MRTTRGTAPKSSSPTSESTLLDLEGGSGGEGGGSREGSRPEHGETPGAGCLAVNLVSEALPPVEAELGAIAHLPSGPSNDPQGDPNFGRADLSGWKLRLMANQPESCALNAPLHTLQRHMKRV